MALQVWLPLNGNLNNQGLNCDATIECSNESYATNGKIGKCFNSSSSVNINIPSLNGSKIWSVCFWGYVNSSLITTNWTRILYIHDNGHDLRVEVCPKTYSNGICCYSVYNNTTYKIMSSSFSNNSGDDYYDKWVHFCLTSDGTTISRYINGVLKNEAPYNGTGAINGNFSLSSNNIAMKNDFRVYDHCLSAKEIKEISKGLVLHYTLNGDILEDGIIYDSSGYGNNGIRYGLLTEDNNSAKYNMSLLFNDSNNNSIKTPFYELTRDECFTVNVWFYKTKLSNEAYDTIFGGPGGFEIETRNRDQTDPVIVLWNWGKGQIPYEFNKWNMLTMTRNLTEAKFYLNGELKFTTDPGTIPQGDYFIGARNTYSQQNFYGNLSDFRIYATVLSDEDIKKLYNVQTSVDNEGNVYSYEFNDSANNMKISKKGIFNHGDFEEKEENKFKSYSDHLTCNTINEI